MFATADAPGKSDVRKSSILKGKVRLMSPHLGVELREWTGIPSAGRTLKGSVTYSVAVLRWGPGAPPPQKKKKILPTPTPEKFFFNFFGSSRCCLDQTPNIFPGTATAHVTNKTRSRVMFIRDGFTWWKAWGYSGVGSSLKFGEQVEAPRGWDVGTGYTLPHQGRGLGRGCAPPQNFFTLWCING